MPTTQRLLTDTTGQALVTAINNIVAAVKPNATEIQMSSSDTTTVATAITNINNKIGTVPSGQTVEEQITTLNSNKLDNIVYGNDSTKTSFDQFTNGLWYVNIDAMSDKPTGATGWGYILSMVKSNQNAQMLFSPEKAFIYWRRYYGTTWRSWEQLASNSDFATSGIRTEVAKLTTSGTAVNYTVSQSGYYTVIASTGNTEGTCTAIIQDTSGNTLLRSTATLARWDNITCGLLPLKAGTTIKAVAVFPSGGAGSVIRIS